METIHHYALLLCILPNAAALAAPDTVSLYFPTNASTLSNEASRQLDSSIYRDMISARYPFQIIGYADDVGGSEYNLRLSRKRAESVKRHLLSAGFREQSMTLVTGRGERRAELSDGSSGRPTDRRVDIVCGKPKDAPVVKEPSTPAAVTAGPRKVSVVDLASVNAGERLLLDNIHFYGGSDGILPQSCDALDALFHSMRKAPGRRICIEGHVCCAEITRTAKDEEKAMELS